jgi:hypothetical protein
MQLRQGGEPQFGVELVSGVVWSKFFWSDWESDQRLRLCSAAAQGLWMRMLCICAQSSPQGYLTLNGRPLGAADLAAVTGWPSLDVEGWLNELGKWGVYSVDGKGRIYSRRMVLDAKKARIAKKNGRGGGNPSLGKGKGSGASDNPPVKGGDKPHKPRAKSQEPEVDNPPTPPAGGAGPSAHMDSFQRAFASYPEAGRASTNPEQAAEAWGEAIADDNPDAIASASAAFAASQFAKSDSGRKVPSFQKWLKQRRYRAWMTAPPVAAFLGPSELREDVVLAMGEAWARTYLDPCAWQDVPERALVPKTTIAGERIAREIGQILRAHSIAIKGKAA